MLRGRVGGARTVDRRGEVLLRLAPGSNVRRRAAPTLQPMPGLSDEFRPAVRRARLPLVRFSSFGATALRCGTTENAG
jgi:hypothetical protein